MSSKRISVIAGRSAVLIACLLVALPYNVSAWTFGCLQDIHAGGNILKTGVSSPFNTTQMAVFQTMKNAQCEYVLFTGDIVGADSWLDDANRSKYAPGGTDSQLIYACAKLALGDFRTKVNALGMKGLYCVGDHEIGDNNTPLGSAKAIAMPYYKGSFAREFTCDPATGKTLFGGTIESVPQRPIGTSYENTSYAFIRNNVLMVTLDLTRFEGPNIQLDPHQGAVSFEMVGAHAAWFDSLCAAGRRTAGVDFIVVQAHYPCLAPVTKQSTSSCFIKGRDTSVFWKIMQKYDVDVYLAGEIHALSTNMDTISQTVQFMGGGRPDLTDVYSSFFIFDAVDKKMTVTVYEVKNQGYAISGTMVIDKRGTKTVTATGTATPVDQKGIVVHYTFDQSNATQPFPCTGQLSAYVFPGVPSNVSTVSGILGNAASFSASGPSYIKTKEQNPLQDDMARSFSAWVKTTSAAQGTISMMGDGASNAFVFYVNNGVPQAMAEGRTISVASTVPKINDGQWHFITVTYPGHAAKFESSQFYIDGEIVAKAPASTSTAVTSNVWGYACLGTQDGSGGKFPYTGAMDDYGAWCGALPAANIKALYNSVVTSDLKYDAAEMDSVFHLFRTKSQGIVQGKTWSYTQGLTGSAGSIMKSGTGTYSIVLNSSGEGVTTGAVAVLRNSIQSGKENGLFTVRRLADGFRLECSNLAPGRYTMRLFGTNGQCLQTYSVKSSGNAVSVALEHGRRLLPGIYVVAVDTEQGRSLVRFVKM